MAHFVFSRKQGLVAIICTSTLRILDCKDGSSKFESTSLEIDQLVKESTEKTKKTTDPNQDVTSTFGFGMIATFSPSNQLFALCTGHKTLVIWNTTTWKCISKRKLLKRATVITFTNKEDCIIVADKSGEVYRFPTNDCDTEGTLLVGHISMITDMVLTDNNGFLITADRDEKIRVTCYPNSYNIQAYCLGHIDFVSKICLLTQLEILISGSGDGSVKFWDYKEGRLLQTEQMDGNSQQQEQDKEDCTDDSSQVVVCMACCQKNNIVCVVGEMCTDIQLYHVTKNSIDKLPSLQTCAPPWHVTFDHDGQLWCLQPNQDEPVIIFQTEGTGPDTKFCKVPSPETIPVYCKACDWKYLEECVGKERRLSVLRIKKDVDNMTDYLTRKEERIKQKQEKLAAVTSPTKKIKLQSS